MEIIKTHFEGIWSSNFVQRTHKKKQQFVFLHTICFVIIIGHSKTVEQYKSRSSLCTQTEWNILYQTVVTIVTLD
jgi:hypothetical protein